MILQKNKFEFQFLNRFKKILKLSAVRKVLETLLFQALGIIETLDSIISHGTLKKFADVRTHLRKVFKIFCLQSEKSLSALFYIIILLKLPLDPTVLGQLVLLHRLLIRLLLGILYEPRFDRYIHPSKHQKPQSNHLYRPCLPMNFQPSIYEADLLSLNQPLSRP